MGVDVLRCIVLQAMLERLQKVQPVYRISDWIDDWQRSEELTQRISAYPNHSTTHKVRACMLYTTWHCVSLTAII